FSAAPQDEQTECAPLPRLAPQDGHSVGKLSIIDLDSVMARPAYLTLVPHPLCHSVVSIRYPLILTHLPLHGNHAA
ncbi:MAG: hypothetical protein M3Y56_16045, partial [Armatimonadota bacterium]|nr:hypothetical protein [Armatimonadota bacterium]